MTLVGDHERERAASALRRHFVQGRLSIEELGERAELALSARSRSELGVALRDLPRLWHGVPAFEAVSSATATARRGARLVAFVLLAGVWAMMSLALAIAFAVTLAVFGPSLAVVIVFAGVWAGVTFVLWRPWLRSRRPASARR
jgi:hypothetical protein